MNLGIDVDITIKSESLYLTIPVIPAEITYDSGNATPVTVSVLQLGDMAFGNGVALGGLSWSSFFPARYDAGYCKTSDLKSPESYRSMFDSFKDNDETLQVIIPAAGINKKMKLTSFKWVFKGFEGDLYYDVTFTEYKEIKPIQVLSEQIIVQDQRPAAPVSAEIQKGDKVRFKGGSVYSSSNQAQAAANRNEALCNCTLTYSGKHPYHLIHYSGDVVYGWVDAANCEKL